MHCVYLLRSESKPDQSYVGFTTDLRSRLKAHNRGDSTHIARFRSWRLNAFLAFKDESTARAFEKYVKTSSGKAFAAKRLWSIAQSLRITSHMLRVRWQRLPEGNPPCIARHHAEIVESAHTRPIRAVA